MKTRLRVGVIFGGRSGEHEVSLASAASVLKALDREKYEVVPIGITPEGRWISSTEALGKLMERTGAEGDEQFLVPEPNRQGLIAALAPSFWARRYPPGYPELLFLQQWDKPLAGKHKVGHK